MTEHPYKNRDLTPRERARDLLQRMTPEEKVAQLGSYWVYQLMDEAAFDPKKSAELLKHGCGQITRIGGASTMLPQECAQTANAIQKYLRENTRLGIPAIVHEEACSGVLARGATVFPQTLGVACTWNPGLSRTMGDIIRRQMRAAGMHQALAPLLDVTRDPRWGRVEETYGEDAYLVGKMASELVKGLQSEDLKNGVAATGKHFVAYGMSEGGMNWAPSHISPREMREVYLAPFEMAVREAGLACVMPGYHEVDGLPCHANRDLLTHTLRHEWGFDGMVVSDYFAVTMLAEYHNIAPNKRESAALALHAGVDAELPNTDSYGQPLLDALGEGSVDRIKLDDAVLRVLELKFRLGLFENPYVDTDKTTLQIDTPEDRQAAAKIARESLVLLKNDGLLPLPKNLASIAVIGPNADDIRNMLGDYTYPAHIESLMEVKTTENTLGQPVPDNVDTDNIHMPRMSSFLAALKAKLPHTQIRYAKGCEVLGHDTSGFEAAARAASESEVALVFVGDKSGVIESCSTGETRDRAHIGLPGVQQQLVEAVVATGKPVVVVLCNGRPFALEWIHENVSALLEAWLPGAAGGEAVADTLFGDFSPGGKLAISFPRSSGQIPVYYGHKKSGGRSYWKGDYVDGSTKPLYPFGYGLSYADFAFSGFSLSHEACGVDDTVEVCVALTNTGAVAGDEVVQLYLNRPHASITRPVKELKGFVRVYLGPGERKQIRFAFTPQITGFYNADMKYTVEPGMVQVMLGVSSEDVKATGAFVITGETLHPETKEFFSHVDVY